MPKTPKATPVQPNATRARAKTKGLAAGKPPVGTPAKATPRGRAAADPHPDGRLERVLDQLEHALGELPKPQDFEPLAEHLYEFARQAPSLANSLQELPRAAVPLQESVRALQETSETMQYLHASVSEALLRLPRPEEYEPLTTPLREFAGRAPGLTSALTEALVAARPIAEFARVAPALTETLAKLPRLVDTLTAALRDLGGGTPPSADFGQPAARETSIPSSDDLRDGLLPLLRAAHEAVRLALATLPRASDYEPFAKQLRELASVSPSLLEWLSEVPRVTTPLGDSVGALRDAVTYLQEARELLGD